MSEPDEDDLVAPLLEPGGVLRLFADASEPPLAAESGSPGDGEPRRVIEGRFEVIREIGVGGMGQVCLAFDRHLGRRVALKWIRADRGGLGLERLQREARALARLRHDHIVGFHDLRDDGNGPYLVMDFVDGVSLQDHLERGITLPIPDAVRIVRDIASALGHAHREHGILHRDVKPANILLELTDDGALTKAVLCDFGLVKAEDDASFTLTGDLCGTPSYMAPEQARGENDLTPAADVYGCGAVLYHLLTGRPPFVGESRAHILFEVARDDREPIPARRLRPELPDDLAAITDVAISPEPQRRYPDGTAFADDLDRFLAGHPVRARAPSRVYRIRRALARNRLAAVFGSVIALSMAMLCAYALVSVASDLSTRHQVARGLQEASLGVAELQRSDPWRAAVEARVTKVLQEAAVSGSLEQRADARQLRDQLHLARGQYLLRVGDLRGAIERLLDTHPDTDVPTPEFLSALQLIASAVHENISPHRAREVYAILLGYDREAAGRGGGLAAADRARALLRCGYRAEALAAWRALSTPSWERDLSVALLEAMSPEHLVPLDALLPAGDGQASFCGVIPRGAGMPPWIGLARGRTLRLCIPGGAALDHHTPGRGGVYQDIVALPHVADGRCFVAALYENDLGRHRALVQLLRVGEELELLDEHEFPDSGRVRGITVHTVGERTGVVLTGEPPDQEQPDPPEVAPVFLSVVHHGGEPTLESIPVPAIPARSYITDVLSADLNADGVPELVATLGPFDPAGYGVSVWSGGDGWRPVLQLGNARFVRTTTAFGGRHSLVVGVDRSHMGHPGIRGIDVASGVHDVSDLLSAQPTAELLVPLDSASPVAAPGKLELAAAIDLGASQLLAVSGISGDSGARQLHFLGTAADGASFRLGVSCAVGGLRSADLDGDGDLEAILEVPTAGGVYELVAIGAPTGLPGLDPGTCVSTIGAAAAGGLAEPRLGDSLDGTARRQWLKAQVMHTAGFDAEAARILRSQIQAVASTNPSEAWFHLDQLMPIARLAGEGMFSRFRDYERLRSRILQSGGEEEIALQLDERWLPLALPSAQGLRIQAPLAAELTRGPIRIDGGHDFGDAELTGVPHAMLEYPGRGAFVVDLTFKQLELSYSARLYAGLFDDAGLWPFALDFFAGTLASGETALHCQISPGSAGGLSKWASVQPLPDTRSLLRARLAYDGKGGLTACVFSPYSGETFTECEMTLARPLPAGSYRVGLAGEGGQHHVWLETLELWTEDDSSIR